MLKNNLPILNQPTFSYIMLRGLEDLPGKDDFIDVSGLIARSLGAISFDSNWTKAENLNKKLLRLDNLVDKSSGDNKKVVFLGVSAGAGLAEAYMLLHPNKIAFMYSLLGVLDPNIDNPQIIKLNKLSKSFKEMTILLSKTLTPEIIKEYHLDEKILSYSSPDDQTVPFITESPSWVIKKICIRPPNGFPFLSKMLGDHAPTIARILLHDIRKQLSELESEGEI